MSQDHFLTLAAGFLLGVLVTAAGAGAFFQVRLATEHERAERAAGEAEQERDRADDLENKARYLRLEAERAADAEQPPPRSLSDEDKRRQEESQKRRQEAFWEEIEKERKKREMLPVPQVLPERPQRQP
jgi:hypothetical protein